MKIIHPDMGSITISCDLLSPHAVNTLLSELDELSMIPDLPIEKQKEVQMLINKLFETRRHLEGK